MAKYCEKPITLRLTTYQRKVLSQIVDGAQNAGACKGGLSKTEANALHSIFMRLIGGSDPESPSPPVSDASREALLAAKEFADHEFSYASDLPRKHRISVLCDKIDAALAKSFDNTGDKES